jgi:hypothetical protein
LLTSGSVLSLFKPHGAICHNAKPQRPKIHLSKKKKKNLKSMQSLGLLQINIGTLPSIVHPPKEYIFYFLRGKFI